MIGLRGYLAAAGVLAIIGLGWWIDARAYARCEADHAAALREKQDEISDLGEEIAQMAQVLEVERRARSAVAREVENEARNDPDGARPGVGSAGMQRLERRWGAR